MDLQNAAIRVSGAIKDGQTWCDLGIAHGARMGMVERGELKLLPRQVLPRVATPLFLYVLFLTRWQGTHHW